MELVYTAGTQIRKVRFLMWLFLALAIGSFWAGLDLFQTYGLNPADGGTLAPASVRLAWGLGVPLLGLALVIGMWVYGRRYIKEIAFDEAEQHMVIRTVGYFRPGTHIAAISDVRIGQSHAGRLSTRGLTVNAPWDSLKIEGKSSTFILDMQGKTINEEVMKRLRTQKSKPAARKKSR